MNCINTSSEEGTSHFPVGSFERPDCWLRLVSVNDDSCSVVVMAAVATTTTTTIAVVGHV